MAMTVPLLLPLIALACPRPADTAHEGAPSGDTGSAASDGSHEDSDPPHADTDLEGSDRAPEDTAYPPGRDPTHTLDEIEVGQLLAADAGCSGYAGVVLHGTDIAATCDGLLFVRDPRSGSELARLIDGPIHSLASSEDIDGDGELDLQFAAYEGSESAVWVAWGPLEGTTALDDVAAVRVYETKESGSLGWERATLEHDAVVEQWAVTGTGLWYEGDSVYLFEGGTRAESLSLDDAVAKVGPEDHYIGAEGIDGRGDVDGDGHTDLVTIGTGASYFGGHEMKYYSGATSIHLGPLQGNVTVGDADVWIPAPYESNGWPIDAGTTGRDVTGDSYDDVLFAYAADYDWQTKVILCLVPGTSNLDPTQSPCQEGSRIEEPAGGTISSSAFEDLDGDGQAEILVGGENSEGARRLWVLDALELEGVADAEADARSVVSPETWENFSPGSLVTLSDELGLLGVVRVCTATYDCDDLALLDLGRL